VVGTLLPIRPRFLECSPLAHCANALRKNAATDHGSAPMLRVVSKL
jgi:hypothetical protein